MAPDRSPYGRNSRRLTTGDDSWLDKVMHHANQMLAYTPPDEVELRQQILALQNALASSARKSKRQ